MACGAHQQTNNKNYEKKTDIKREWTECVMNADYAMFWHIQMWNDAAHPFISLQPLCCFGVLKYF